MEMTKRIGLFLNGESEKEVRDYILFNAPNSKLILMQETESEIKGLKNFFFESVMPVKEFEHLKSFQDIQIINGYVKDEDLEEGVIQ